MDIDADRYGKVTNKEIFDYIREHLEWDQMIWEFGNDSQPDWVHVSFKATGNRRQILKAIKEGASTEYVKY